MFAYKLRFSFGYLSMGVSGGVSAKSSNYHELALLSVEDPYLRVQNNDLAPNFGVGVYFYNSRMYAGVSVPYLLNTER